MAKPPPPGGKPLHEFVNFLSPTTVCYLGMPLDWFSHAHAISFLLGAPNFVFCSITGVEMRSSLTDMTPEASISGSMLDLGQVRLRKQTEKIKLRTRNKKPSSHWASRLGRKMSNKDYYFARFVAVSSSMNGCSPQLRSSCCRAKGATCWCCRAEGAT